MAEDINCYSSLLEGKMPSERDERGRFAGGGEPKIGSMAHARASSALAEDASHNAHALTDAAMETGSKEDLQKAIDAHKEAASAHFSALQSRSATRGHDVAKTAIINMHHGAGVGHANAAKELTNDLTNRSR